MRQTRTTVANEDDDEITYDSRERVFGGTGGVGAPLAKEVTFHNGACIHVLA